MVRVELVELDGREGNHAGTHTGHDRAPAVVTFSVEVVPPLPLLSGTMLWMVLVASIALVGGWIVRARARLGVADGTRLNLLDVSWVRRALAGASS